jgi:hypothetical protein
MACVLVRDAVIAFPYRSNGVAHTSF